MPGQSKLGKRLLVGLTLLAVGIGLVALFLPRLVSGNESDDKTIARGGGTTIIHGVWRRRRRRAQVPKVLSSP